MRTDALWTRIMLLQDRLFPLLPTDGPSARPQAALLLVNGVDPDATTVDLEQARTALRARAGYLYDVHQPFIDRSAWHARLAAGAHMVARVHLQDALYRDVLERVLKEVQRRHVVLVGVSYGGLIAGKVAEAVARTPFRTRLHLRTFGSLYRPRFTSSVDRGPPVDVDADHYVFYGDEVATLRERPQDRTAPCIDRRARIIWLPDPPQPAADPGRWFMKLKRRVRRAFQVHDSYAATLFTVVSRRETALQPATLERVAGFPKLQQDYVAAKALFADDEPPEQGWDEQDWLDE